MIPLLPEIARRPMTAMAAAAALFLAGCADMGQIDSHAKLRDADSLGLSAQAAELAAPSVDSRWWLGFGDTQLNVLIDQALQGNPNLQVAQARLERAQAAVGVAEAARKPKLDGQLDLTRQKFSGNSIYPAPLGGSIQELGTLQLNASWELDFFGKNRTAIETAVGSANAAAADADAARVLLAGNVARAYVQWARLDDQLAVAQRTLTQREETLKLVRDRVSAGLDTRLEQYQSEGGLPQARQQIEALNEQIEIAQHALDALVAKPGAAQALTAPKLAGIRPIALQPSIPANLLGRRADIAAARWRVEAATSDVANARTQFYPNINLVAFAGLSSIGLDNFVKAGSETYGIGPAIRLPIFEGGRLRANLSAKNAEVDAAIDGYNAALLRALREVADEVSTLQSLERQQVAQDAALKSAEQAFDLSVQRYQSGLGNYLVVLTAETNVLAQRRAASDLKARHLSAEAALSRALGGGYQGEAATTLAAVQSQR